MTKNLLIASLLGLIWYDGLAQTCTITDPDADPMTNTTVLWTAATCSETGLAPVNGDNVIVPLGVRLNIPTGGLPISPTPFFTGNINVFGELINTKTNAQLDGNIVVENGGLFVLNKKLFVGINPGCGFSVVVKSGGTLDLTGGGAADRLSICGVAIAQSGGGCGPYPTGPLPYCEPGGGGFPSPLGFDETGNNPALPIKLAYFTAELIGEKVAAKWATDKEENFDHFEIERANNNLNFSNIGEVQGAGYNTNTLQKYLFIDDNPIIGNNYYRLKAVDLDRSYEYFNVVLVSTTGKKNFTVFPNPSNGESLKYRINFDYSPGDGIVILDNMGNVLNSLAVSASEDDMKLSETLKPGIYFLKYTSNAFHQTVKVIVH